MTAAVIQRAQILIDQRRYQDAISYLLEHLATLPNDSYALYMLAFCHIQLKQPDEAEIVVNNALSIDPTRDTLFFQRARIAFMKDQHQEAIQAIKEAIGLNPKEPEYFSFWSQILLSKGFYKEGLAKAEEGLALNPEHEESLNMRSNALFHLGEKEAAFSDLKEVLSRNPEDAYSHASMGWKRLEDGDHRQAEADFRESLKLAPDQLWSKRGLILSLQSRYWIFRQILKYIFFVNRQRLLVQLLLIVGLLVLGHLISNQFFPVSIVLGMMSIAPWLLDPATDLFLRLHPNGRFALPQQQTSVSLPFGILLFLAITAGLGYCIAAVHILLAIAVVIGGMVLPITNVVGPNKKHPGAIVLSYTLIIAAMAMAGIWKTVATGDLLKMGIVIIIIGVLVYQLMRIFVFHQKS